MTLDTEISEKLDELESRNMELLEEARKVVIEKEFMESEMARLQREIRRLRAEMERLKKPPMIIGYIKDVLINGKAVVKSTTGPEFIVNSADYVHGLEIGSRVALNKQTLAVVGSLPPSLDPMVMGAEIIKKPEVSYKNIGGLEDQLNEVKETVELPLKKPELYKKVGIEPPKGILLVGPPGTGKTLIAKAVARETHAVFIRLVSSELVQKYIGEGARLVRELFDLAKQRKPAIVFIDEIDAIGSKRVKSATSGDREVQRTLMQLLAELDGFEPLDGVMFVAATNRPDMLDEALLRPGRFDRIIEIPIPDWEERKAIFKVHMKPMNTEKKIRVDYLASKTDGTSGADIKAICTEAGMFAIREDRSRVKLYDFERAIDKIMNMKIKDLVPEPMFA